MKRCVWSSIAFLAFAFVLANLSVGCGGGGTPPPNITVSAKIIMADGTEKDLSDTPLPLNLKVQITFSEPVDTTLAEALFSLMAGNRTVATTISWNADNTVMIAKPRNILNYQTTYTVTITAGAVTADVGAAVGKADVDAFSSTFATMVNGDVNGDGQADISVPARAWNAGGNTGRTYLFYGNRISSGSAASADAIITGEAAGDLLINLWAATLDFDLNDDGYADVFSFAPIYPAGAARGRSYIFYGGAGDTPISGALDAANADVVMTGEADADAFNAPYVGDVNGDGYSDLVGRSPSSSAGTGRVYAFYGPSVASEDASQADVIFTGENASDVFGALLRLGDVNGDGIADFVITAPSYNSGDGTGAIYVFYGGSALASASAASADVIITGENVGDGLQLKTLGDVNDDGIMDIAATAPMYNALSGRAYLFYGGSLASGDASTANVILDGEAGANFGVSAFLLGDVNGDGLDDAIIGTVNYDTMRGRVYGFYGGSSLSSKNAADADFIFTGENQNDSFDAFALGDINGDGIDDIVCNASRYPNAAMQGRIYGFFGGSAISSNDASNADVILTGENNGDMFFAERLQDVNGDGVMDIFGGAPRYNGGGNTGRGYLFYGGSSLASTGAASASAIIDGENAGDLFSQ